MAAEREQRELRLQHSGVVIVRKVDSKVGKQECELRKGVDSERQEGQ